MANEENSQTTNEESAQKNQYLNTASQLFNLYKNLPKNTLKKIMEVAMRSANSITADPKDRIINLGYTIKQNPSEIYNPLKYVLFGSGKSYIGDNNYGGLWRENDYEYFNPESLKDDLVTTYLYNTPLNPKIAKSVKDEKDPNNYGLETEYIKNTYPDRKNILYVEVEPYGIKKVNQNNIVPIDTVGARFNFPTSIKNVRIDNNGANIIFGKRNDSTFIQGYDVWDFNPGPYNEKFGIENSQHKYINEMDKQGTPIVMRTPWIPFNELKNLDIEFNGNLPTIAFKDFLKLNPLYELDFLKYQLNENDESIDENFFLDFNNFLESSPRYKNSTINKDTGELLYHNFTLPEVVVYPEKRKNSEPVQNIKSNLQNIIHKSSNYQLFTPSVKKYNSMISTKTRK